MLGLKCVSVVYQNNVERSPCLDHIKQYLSAHQVMDRTMCMSSAKIGAKQMEVHCMPLSAHELCRSNFIDECGAV